MRNPHRARTEYRQLLAAAQPGQAERKYHDRNLAMLDAIAEWDTGEDIMDDLYLVEMTRHFAALAIVRAQPAYRAVMARTRRWVLSKHGQFQHHADVYRQRRVAEGAWRRQLLDGRLTPKQYATQVAASKADMRSRIASYDRQTGHMSRYKLRKQSEWIQRQLDNPK